MVSATEPARFECVSVDVPTVPFFFPLESVILDACRCLVFGDGERAFFVEPAAVLLPFGSLPEIVAGSTSTGRKYGYV